MVTQVDSSTHYGRSLIATLLQCGLNKSGRIALSAKQSSRRAKDLLEAGLIEPAGQAHFKLSPSGKTYLLETDESLFSNRYGDYLSLSNLREVRANLGAPAAQPPKPIQVHLPSGEIQPVTDNSEPHVNLALMTIPDDSPLATASWADRQKALNLNPDGSPKTETKRKKRVVIASTNPVKIGAVKAAFAEMVEGWGKLDFTGVIGLSGVKDQPMSYAETRQGAENRARGVFDSYTDTLYSVGIEGGIEDGPDGMRSFAVICIFDGQTASFARTAEYYLPHEVATLVREGKELGEADDLVFKATNSKQVNGSIGLLTHNSITRMEFYTQAVIMALIPFENKSLTWPSPAPTPTPAFDLLDMAILPHDVDDLWDRTVRIDLLDGSKAEDRGARVRYVLPDGRLSSERFNVKLADLKPFPSDRTARYEKVDLDGKTISINRVALSDPTVMEHLPENWISAVKIYRQLTNTDLKDAKDAIDYAKIHMVGYLDARVVAAAETQAVKDAAFAPGTTAKYDAFMDASVLILESDVNGLSRRVFFLDPVGSANHGWVSVGDLYKDDNPPTLAEALHTMMEYFETAEASVARRAEAPTQDQSAPRATVEAEKAVRDFATAYVTYKTAQDRIVDTTLAVAQITDEMVEKRDNAKTVFEGLAWQLGHMLGMGLVILQGEDPERAKDDLVHSLRTQLASLGVDLGVVRNTLRFKSDQVQVMHDQLVKLTQQVENMPNVEADRDETKKLATLYGQQLAEVKLQLAQAHIALVNAQLDKVEGMGRVEASREPGRVEHLAFTHEVNLPEDRVRACAETDERLNSEEGWAVAYMVINSTPVGDRIVHTRYVELKREIADEPVAPDEDETKAAAAAPIPNATPVPQPVLSHEIIIGVPVAEPQVRTGSIADLMKAGVPLERIKDGLNQQHVDAGIKAGLDFLEQNLPDPEASVPASSGLLVASN